MADRWNAARYMPIAGWLPTCTSASIRADVIAGIAVAGLLVPEGMAYAGIAGVAPQIGLYAAMAGMFFYALFGTSRQLAVTATSSSAAMTAAVVAPLAGGDSVQYATLVAAAAIAAGLIFIVGGLFKLGSVAEFISKPVLKGFVFGLGLTIMVKQMGHLTGMSRGKGAFFEQLWHVLKSIAEINGVTVTVGIVALTVLILLGHYLPRIPSALVVLVLGILAVKFAGLDQRGVEVVGDIQARLPSVRIPRVNPELLGDVLLGTVGIVLVLTAEALAAGRTFAAKHKYETDANQELFAMGAANIASGFLGGMIVGGGMSGTAANDAGGARTQISTIAASLFVALTLAFLMPSIRLLPEAVLAAIVIHAVAHLVDFKQLKYYAQIKTGSVWVALTAIFGVLLFGILKGLVLAVGLTLVAVMKKLSTPQEAVLGRLPGTGKFADIRWHPEALAIQGILLVRPNAMLFFANANRVLNHVRTLLKSSDSSTRAVVLDLEASPEIDITSVEMLAQMNEELKASGTTLYLAKVPGRVVELFKRSGLLQKLRDEQICEDVDAAVKCAEELAPV